MVAIIITLTYAITDVYRRCNSPSLCVRSNRLMTNGGNESVAFVGGGAPREAMLRFVKLLEPERVGNTFVGKPAGAPLQDKQIDNKKSVGILSILKRGHEPEKMTAESNGQQMEEHKQEGLLGQLISRKSNDNVLFELMGKDPLIYFSAATSKFVKNYSPFRAKAFMTKNQLMGKLVCPQPTVSGSAFVLPTGHVINKAIQVTEEDLEAWNPPPASDTTPDASSRSLLTPQGDSNRHRLTDDCSRSDPIHRINLYGFAGSQSNKLAKQFASVEMLVCNCPTHASLLEAPDASTYSSVPDQIQVNVVAKRVLFPGPGTEPLQSRQVTAAAHLVNGAGGEHDISDEPVTVPASDDYSPSGPVVYKPVYGSGLVTLPTPGAPICLNGPCTDRPDGIYPVTNKVDSTGVARQSRTDTILQRDIVGYLNANPVEASKLTIGHDSEHIISSWVATGRSVSAIMCKGERIERIK